METIEKLKILFESFHEAIYIVNKERKILYFNPKASQISGFSKGDMVNSFCFDNLLNHVNDDGDHLCLGKCPLVQSIVTNEVTTSEVYLHHKNGHRVKVLVTAIPYEENGEVAGAIEVFTDVTETNSLLEKLLIQKRLNMIDPLTGLFNRRFLHEEFPELQKGIPADERLGILFIDIDNFKSLNDRYGHLIGDEILKIVSKTIQYNLKSNDFVIRYGGDEILVLLRQIDQDTVEYVAEKLRILVKNSGSRDIDKKTKTTISVGATILDHKESLLQAINRADHAMYLAKSKGANQVVFLNKDY
ncbi:MAG: GGDEF domain-containing protein [Tenericutes bacterium HGW-Tenericutes-3]|nr:MAG: GGDEF domain-containing protein [Tenericutes bacterium HGW-Tenericutes-3]